MMENACWEIPACRYSLKAFRYSCAGMFVWPAGTGDVVPDKVPFRRGERMPAGEDFGLKSRGITLSHGRKALGANSVLRAV